jgi:hypothetical protein
MSQTRSGKIRARLEEEEDDDDSDDEYCTLEEREFGGPLRKKTKSADGTSRKPSKTFTLGASGDVWASNSRAWDLVFTEAVRQWKNNADHTWDEDIIQSVIKGELSFKISADAIKNRLNNQRVPKKAPTDIKKWSEEWKGRGIPPVSFDSITSYLEEANNLIREHTRSQADKSSSITNLSKAAKAASAQGVEDLSTFRPSSGPPAPSPTSSSVQPTSAPPQRHPEAVIQRQPSLASRQQPPPMRPRPMEPNAQEGTQIDLDVSHRATSGRVGGLTWSHQQYPENSTLFLHVLSPLNGTIELTMGKGGDRTVATLVISPGDLSFLAASGVSSKRTKELGEFTSLFKQVEPVTYRLKLPLLAGYPGFKQLDYTCQEMDVRSECGSVLGNMVFKCWEYEVMN